jgi:hypothetical protein
MTDIVTVSLIGTVGAVLVAMIQRLSTRVDGRLTELLALTKKSSHAEGMKDEKQNSIDGSKEPE